MSPKICEFAKFYPHENLSTKLANKYTLENEMKVKNCEQFSVLKVSFNNEIC